MTIPLPDGQLQLQAAANASGVATCSLPQNFVAGAAKMIVSQIYVSTNSANSTTATVLLNGYGLTSTVNGNGDTADGDPPIPVSSKDSLQIQWTGCVSGDQCQAIIYYTFVNPQGPATARSRRPTDQWQGN